MKWNVRNFAKFSHPGGKNGSHHWERKRIQNLILMMANSAQVRTRSRPSAVPWGWSAAPGSLLIRRCQKRKKTDKDLERQQGPPEGVHFILKYRDARQQPGDEAAGQVRID